MKYRTALITGASSGIGLELARLIAAQGIEVVLAARRVELLEEEAERIRTNDGEARALALDVTNVEETQQKLGEIDDELGGIDLLIANAGVGKERWSGKLRWAEDCEAIIEVNVKGFVATVTALAPRMVERKRGHIAGVSSLAKYAGLPRNAAYCASKAFVSTFLESLRVDLSSTPIQVTDIRPGYVRTPMTAETQMPLPFIKGAAEAADIIWSGIRRGKAVVEFPWPLIAALNVAKVSPHALYDAVIKTALK